MNKCIYLKHGLFLLFTISILSGCGGSSKDAVIPPPMEPSLFTGQAVDARIKNGTIEVFPFNNFDTAALLGSTKTDDSGFYEISVASESKAVSVRLSGGSYIEESSGVEVNLKDGQYLYAATYYESPNPITIMVTPFTSFAHGLAVWKTKQGTPFVNAVAESASAISSIYSVDILSTFPINITDQVGPNIILPIDDRAQYGFLAAALSALTYSADLANPHSFYNSISLAQIMYTDILSDGLLDGHAIVNGFYTQLSFGPILLDANTYRSKLALKMLEAANADYNLTGITVNNLLPSVTQIAASTHDIFSNFPISPIDIDPPTIGTNETGGKWYSGNIVFHVFIDDFVGVNTVIIDVDGFVLPEVTGNLNDVNYTIDTVDLMLAFGEHKIGVRATDLLGNEGYKQFIVNVNNDGPSANITSYPYTNNPNYLITGTYDDLGVGMSTVLVNDIVADINSTDKTFSVNVPMTLGQMNLHIVATDSLGNEFTDNTIINFDVKRPLMQFVHSNADFLLENGTTFNEPLANDNQTWPIYISTDKVSLQGTLVNPANLNAVGVPYFGVLIKDQFETGAETLPEDLVIEYKYSIGLNEIFPFKSAANFTSVITSQVPVYLPLVTEVLGDNWYVLNTGPSNIHKLTIRATDKAGNTEEQVFTFMVQVYIPSQNVTNVSAIDIFTENAINFSARTSVFDTMFDSVSYTYPNNNNFPILVKLLDSSNHSLTNTYEEAIRENQVHLVTQEQWQGDFAYLGDTWLSTGVIPVTSIQLVNGNFNYNNANLLDMFNLYNANPDPAGTGPLGTPTYTTVTVPASTNGPTEIVDTDSPVAPTPSAWTSYSPATTNYYRHQFYPNTTLWPGTIDDTLNYMLPDPIAYTNQYGQQAAFAYAHIQHSSSALVSSNYTHSNTLQKRTNYFYESESGFPKNTVTTGTVSASANTAGFVVLDKLGKPIPVVLGFYRIPANTEVQIIKQVTLPSVPSYNDTEIGNLATFASYITKSFDKSFDVAINTGIEVDAYIDIGYIDTSKLAPTKNNYAGEQVSSIVTR